jgi:hypothetical protein
VTDGTGVHNWLFFKDKNSPAIDTNNDGDVTDPTDLPAFSPGEAYVTPRRNGQIQPFDGQFFPALSPDYLYLEADFGTAGAQTPYKTGITLEYYIQ